MLRNDLVSPGGQLVFAPAADQFAGQDPLIVLAGDVNNDGRDDMVTVAASTPTSFRGQAPADQVSTLVSKASCRGDVNRDGDVNVFDFGVLARHFGQYVPPGTLGDANADGVVNVFDFGIFARGFGCKR